MTKHVLLLGRTPFDLDEVQAEVTARDVELFAGTNLDDVRTTLAHEERDAVIRSAGIPLQDRLAIIEYVFEASIRRPFT